MYIVQPIHDAVSIVYHRSLFHSGPEFHAKRKTENLRLGFTPLKFLVRPVGVHLSGEGLCTRTNAVGASEHRKFGANFAGLSSTHAVVPTAICLVWTHTGLYISISRHRS